MRRLGTFVRKPAEERRMLVRAAVVSVIVVAAVRGLRFGRAQRILARLATAARPRAVSAVDAVDARIVRAVRAVGQRLPGGTCLTEALAAQILFAQHDRETTLCWGISRPCADDRPFDAHAWLERRGATVVGARGIAYHPLAPPSRCASSPSAR